MSIYQDCEYLAPFWGAKLCTSYHGSGRLSNGCCETYKRYNTLGLVGWVHMHCLLGKAGGQAQPPMPSSSVQPLQQPVVDEHHDSFDCPYFGAVWAR